jgi:CO/xanthine dehydrogenase FAD-binding subunit
MKMDLAVGVMLRPASLQEALRWLLDHPSARPLAGGTDLIVQLRDGRRRADALLDLSRLGLDGIREHRGELEIGACTPMDTIAGHPAVRSHCPALAQAAGQIGAWPIQCRATLGGNLANASPAADTAPPLLVAGAAVRIAATTGERELALDEFFQGPGKAALAPGELIVAVHIPACSLAPGERVVERFFKVGARREQVISIASLAGRAVLTSTGMILSARLALGSVGPTPLRARRAEAALAGGPVTSSRRRHACEQLQADLAPIDDVRAPASYRRIAAAVLLDRFLAEAANG